MPADADEQSPDVPLEPIPSGELHGATEIPGGAGRGDDRRLRQPSGPGRPRPRPPRWPPSRTARPRCRRPTRPTAAFFDVDNTMMIGASIFHFARGLAARKFFTTADLAGFAWQQLKFRVGGRETRYSTTTGRDTALSFVAGRSVAEITAIGEEIYDELMADRIWAGTRALAQMHLDAGHRVWLVTATPVELALIIARRLGLTGALGTVAESVDGYYTGRLVGEILHGPAKAHAVQALAAAEGLDLSRCTAYSDSVNDVPMLSAVGTAVAINPDPSCATSPGSGAGRSATSGPAARRPGSACPRCSAPARWPARSPAWHRPRPGKRSRWLSARRLGSALRARRRAMSSETRRPFAPRTPATTRRSRTDSDDSAQERVAALAEQPVEGVLDGLPDLVVQVEHDHRVVGRGRAEGAGVDRLAELDVPLGRQRDQPERAEQREQRGDREVRGAEQAGQRLQLADLRVDLLGARRSRTG